MEEIRIWELKKDNDNRLSAKEIQSVRNTETEKQLEDLLVDSPDILMPNLKLIGRQTTTEGGPLDLLGVDENGFLIVFELKRGTLYRETVAQVLDYASYLADLDDGTLADHISSCSGILGIEKIEDFKSWYESNFPEHPDRYSEPPRMVLVGLGVDDRTKRMVNYLSKRDVNISLVVFQAFERDGGIFLAKRIEVEEKLSESGIQQRYTKSENVKILDAMAEKLGVTELLKSMKEFFRSQLRDSIYNEFVLRTGYSYGLREQTEEGSPTYRVYFGLYLDSRKPGTVCVLFQKRACESAPDSFNKLLSDKIISEAESKWYFLRAMVTAENWDSMSGHFKKLISDMVSGWKKHTAEENETAS